MKETLRTVARIMAITLTLAFLGYVGLQTLLLTRDTYKTETAISYTMTDSFSAEGVVSFEEAMVPGAGSLGFLVGDGERVSAGSSVAEVYTDAGQSAARDALTRLDSRIALLENSRNVAGSDVDMLVAQVDKALFTLVEAVDSGAYGEMEAGEEAYLLAANRLQVSTGQVSGFGELIDTLRPQREEALALLGSPEQILAPASGYFVSEDTAQFVGVSREELAAMSAWDLREALANGVSASAEGYAGKVITSYRWDFFTVVSAEQGAAVEAAGSVGISFPGKFETVLPAAVERVETDEVNGISKITLSCEYASAGIMALGQDTASISLKQYEGVRIAAKALHIVDDEKGVYVKYGNIARFRRIEILYQDEDYILVPPGGAIGTSNEVRLYDEILVEGRGLTDGKIL